MQDQLREAMREVGRMVDALRDEADRIENKLGSNPVVEALRCQADRFEASLLQLLTTHQSGGNPGPG